ncbi:MAG: hypothetical protein GY928_16560 [Colwellia sp.]|nr:hypothetical protein [Colwellia sp.]
MNNRTEKPEASTELGGRVDSVVMLHYDAIPIIIEFVKKCESSSDESVRIAAIHTLQRWDRARGMKAT